MFLKFFCIYKPNVDPTYIANTLSCIHLLPLNEQIEHFNIILQYFNMNSKRIAYFLIIMTGLKGIHANILSLHMNFYCFN